MNPPAECDKVLLVQAELDGELAPADAAALASHKASCPVCKAAAVELSHARALIDRSLYHPVPDELRQRIARQIGAGRQTQAPLSKPSEGAFVGRWRRWFAPFFSFGLGAACAAGLSLLLLWSPDPSLTEQIVAGHIRAMQPGHLDDVASSDRHTVKPWFAGRLDFTPPVKDFAAAGFPLRGGRLDYIAGQPVAALVYQRDRHVIDLFVWPAAGDRATAPEAAQRKGYNVVHWTQDGMNFWAVSDVELEQLRDFAETFRRTP